MIPYDKHPFHKRSVQLATELRRHADGETLGELIEERRPAESLEIKNYRQKIFKSVTQGPFGKVKNTLMKIRKSPDWSILFDKDEATGIAKGETLKDFTETGFFKWTSVTNWWFSTVMRYQMIDVNAVILWQPKDIAIPDNELPRPFPVIYPSDRIITYEEDKYYILESIEKNKFKDEGGREHDGDVYYEVSQEHVRKMVQVNLKADSERFKEEYKWIHGLGRCPITPIPGEMFEQGEKQVLKKSRLAPMVPRFDEAGREYSDLQAEIVQHIHSTMWAYEAQKCVTCKGFGQVEKTDTTPAGPCAKCKGKGTVPFNPYEHIVIGKGKLDEQEVKPPFAGYIEKSVEIAVLQDSRIQNHIYYGFASIGMEHLAEVPLSQSGTAKDFDRQETEAFVYTFAEDTVAGLDESMQMICDIRYGFSVKDSERRKKMLPKINVPEKYDMFSESYLTDEMKKLRDSKASPAVIIAAEVEVAQKKFATNPEIAKKARAYLELDPFGGTDELTVSDWKLNGGISDEAFLVHCNIKELVEEASAKDAKFFDKTREEQKAAIYALAKQLKINLMTPIDAGQTDPGAGAGGK